MAEFLDLCADINVSPSVATKQSGNHTMVTVKLSLEDLVAIVAAMR